MARRWCWRSDVWLTLPAGRSGPFLLAVCHPGLVWVSRTISVRSSCRRDGLQPIRLRGQVHGIFGNRQSFDSQNLRLCNCRWLLVRIVLDRTDKQCVLAFGGRSLGGAVSSVFYWIAVTAGALGSYVHRASAMRSRACERCVGVLATAPCIYPSATT